LSPKNIFQVLPLDLKKKTFIFIDEIQYLKDPTNFLKYLDDQYQEKLKLIVSGSSAFYIDRRFKDSLVGRKKIFYVYPASLKEFFAFKGFEFDKPYSKLTLVEKDQYKKLFFEYLVYGGYPRVILSPFEEKKEVLRDLLYSYIKKDVYEGGVRQEDVFYRLLKILASQIGNLVNQFELSLTLGVSKTAIENYLYLMQKSFHLCLIRPFFKNIRKELTKMPKIYFYDLGLRNFLVNNFQPFLMRDDQGALLENYFFHLFLEEKYPDEIKFWRTTEGQEVDFIMDNTAYEVKVNKKILKPSKYQLFQKKYPQIKLKIVGLEEAMES
jgi:Predicted ATPase (AAA+ superfamily)